VFVAEHGVGGEGAGGVFGGAVEMMVEGVIAADGVVGVGDLVSGVVGGDLWTDQKPSLREGASARAVAMRARRAMVVMAGLFMGTPRVRLSGAKRE
jgi:hypothetical protein